MQSGRRFSFFFFPYSMHFTSDVSLFSLAFLSLFFHFSHGINPSFPEFGRKWEGMSQEREEGGGGRCSQEVILKDCIVEQLKWKYWHQRENPLSKTWCQRS
jgi:hypothetical protein